jgi:hypothetical protein
MKDSDNVEAARQDVLVDVGNMGKETQQIQERRRSERLKKSANLTTMEKVTHTTQIPFQPYLTMILFILLLKWALLLKMMVLILAILLNALETARNDLYLKQLEQHDIPQTEAVEENNDIAENPALTWLHDESF